MDIRQLLPVWNNTGSEYPRESSIHKLFEAQAERTPSATAVDYDEERITYGELNQQANQLARHLESIGAEPGTFIGLCLERSVLSIVAMLAIFKSGGTLVPLDLELPKERLGFILSDTNSPILITESRLLERLPAPPLLIYTST